MKTRILVVAPYPVKNPMHGGQKRVQALLARYREISNEVSFVAVYLDKSYGDAYKTDIAIFNDAIYKQLSANPELTDIVTGLALSEVEDVKLAFISVLKKKRPDVIHVEQPYMVESVAAILKEINMNSLIIFGSQNVEFEMKRGIFKSLIPKDTLSELVKKTRSIEKKAVQLADVVVAVSTYDLEALTKGFKFKPCFVIPNGIEKPSSNVPKTNEWAEFKKKENIETLATFVGSAHPPNYLGFITLLAEAQIPPEARIVVAGGMSTYIRERYKDEAKFETRVAVVGVLSRNSLQALIHESDIILLPILNGGGSNLKTAEAIISGKKIVATEYAFRGYEQYMSLPNIYIANTKKAFKTALNKSIISSYVQLSSKQNKLAETVTWPYALVNMKYVVFVSKLLRFVQKLGL